MRRLPLCILVVAMGCFATDDAFAHPATERYIPIGESPGLSGEATYIGHIREANPSTRTLSVESEEGERQSVLVTPESDMWMDRSEAGRPSEDASFEDCKRGRRVEIKLHEDSREADWIKIEAR